MVRAKRGQGTFLLIAIAGTLAGCDAPPPPVEPGVPWALAAYRVETVRSVRYALEFTVPADREAPVEGSLIASVDLTDGGSAVVLDFAASPDQVHAVTVNGEPSVHEFRDEHIVIPGNVLAAGVNDIGVAFAAGDLSLNRHDEFLYTLFVPDRARYAYPVFDQPNIKGRYRLTMHVPMGWEVVGNGPETGRDTTDTGVTFRFAETRPIPSYLFSFVAGRFELDSAIRDGRTLRMLHREPDAEKVARNRDAVYDLHATALSWLEEYTQIPYPFDKFDFVLVPSFQYGGMEHPGAILYRESSLLLDPAATLNDLLGRARLIAHETAHMWFGDLVTMNWFDDVWTKEVFANFMAAKIVNPSFPEVDHELRFLLSHYPAAYGVDRTSGANPIRQPLENLAGAGSLYGAIIYNKAPVAMRQLETRLGADAFRDGLREYLATHAYANATWPDLIALLDARTPDDLDRWSRMWVEEAGRPRILTELSVGADGRIDALRLRQEDPLDRARTWPQNLELLLQYADTAIRFGVDLSGVTTTVGDARGRPAPLFVLANGDGVGYGEFVPDSRSLAYLADAVEDISDPLVRGVAWITLWDAVLVGALAPARFLETARRGLRRETVDLNIQRILGYLQSVYWQYLTPAERMAVGPGLDGQLWETMNRAARLTTRTAYFRAYRSLLPTDVAVERLTRMWRYQLAVPGLPLAERDYATIALELAVREVPGWRGMLEEQLERMSNPDRRDRFAFVMDAVSADPSARDAFFERLRDPRNREREPWVLEALRFLHHPLRAQSTERYILPSLELVEEIQATGDIFFPLGWLNATLGGHASPHAAQIVREFLAARPDYPPRLRGKILQAADDLFRSVAMRDRP